jgi:hypothetical protein
MATGRHRMGTKAGSGQAVPTDAGPRDGPGADVEIVKTANFGRKRVSTVHRHRVDFDGSVGHVAATPIREIVGSSQTNCSGAEIPALSTRDIFGGRTGLCSNSEGVGRQRPCGTGATTTRSACPTVTSHRSACSTNRCRFDVAGRGGQLGAV